MTNKIWIGILGMALLASCAETNKEKNATGDEDTMVLQNAENIGDDKMDYTNWQQVDFAAPIVAYDEIRSRDIVVREQKDRASIFTIEDNILFDFDKAEIRDEGKQKLDEIATAIKNKYPDGAIGIYGYTDNIGTESYNQELSQERANAVKQYLQQHTGIDMSRINTYAKGEADESAATAAGRQQNRKVDIVAQNNR